MNNQKIPESIDHLVYTAPTLELGIEKIEKLLGVKPVIGGHHPNYGTHNALLSLGDSIYLEVIAPDPDLDRPERGRLLEESYAKEPRLTTWVLRSENIEELYNSAFQNGLILGALESGKREKPDGSILSWVLSDPYAFPLEGAIPFLISWGKTPHPAKAVPSAGELVAFKIGHPDPDMVMKNLKHLGVDFEVSFADSIILEAKIKTSKGILILK